MLAETLPSIRQQLGRLMGLSRTGLAHGGEPDGGLPPVDGDEGRLVDGGEVHEGHDGGRAVLPDYVFGMAVHIAEVGTDEVAVVVP